MTFIDNAAEVLKKAWSIRLSMLAALFSAAEVALPFFTDFVPPHTMAIVAVFTAAGAAVARLIAQPKIAK
jgi:hypothetical protein